MRLRRRTPRRGVSVLAALAVLAAPAAAYAGDAAPGSAEAQRGAAAGVDRSTASYPGDGPLGSYQTHWEATLGVRAMFITGAGFDPYATDNVFTQFSLGGGRTLLARDRFSLVLLGFWDYGQRKATARSDLTQLDVHRFSIGSEIRYHVIPRLFVFARAAPGVLYTSAELTESVTAATLYSRSWVVGFDGTAGAAFEVIGKRSGESKKPRFWIVGEGGYSWAAPADVNLRPASDDKSAPARVAAVSFPTLLLRGAMFRLSVATTF